MTEARKVRARVREGAKSGWSEATARDIANIPSPASLIASLLASLLASRSQPHSSHSLCRLGGEILQ